MTQKKQWAYIPIKEPVKVKSLFGTKEDTVIVGYNKVEILAKNDYGEVGGHIGIKYLVKNKDGDIYKVYDWEEIFVA